MLIFRLQNSVDIAQRVSQSAARVQSPRLPLGTIFRVINLVSNYLGRNNNNRAERFSPSFVRAQVWQFHCPHGE